MKKNFILFFLMFFCVTAFGQNTTEKSQNTIAPDERVFDVVEEQPSFPGGQGELMQWLSANINYPVTAVQNGVQGRVIVQFVVSKTGEISDIKVTRGVDPSLDKEAVRVVSAMPKWTPGRQGGKAVNVRYTLPVTFRLDAYNQKTSNEWRH